MHRRWALRWGMLTLGGLAAGPFAAASPRPDDKPPAPTEPKPKPKPIDAATAVKLAEGFVRVNGYTDFEPPDPAKLAPETLEMSPRGDWAAFRRGTLRPRAVGYLAEGKDGPDSWTVGFEYADRPAGASNGRAVTMDAAGKKLVVQHKDLRMDILEPCPADPKLERKSAAK